MRSIVLKSLLIAGAGVAMIASATGAAQASPKQDAYYKHTQECVRLFLTDPAKHDEICGPSRVVITYADISVHFSSSTPLPPLPTPPPSTKPEDPCKPKCPPPPCYEGEKPLRYHKPS